MKFLIILLLTFCLSTYAQVVLQGSSLPVGTILEYIGSSAPTGYLLVDGSCISQTTYAKLYSMLGTTYGNGCGAGLFKLPDFRGAFLRGAGTNATDTIYSGGTVGTKQFDMFQGHRHANLVSTQWAVGLAGNYGAADGGGANQTTGNSVTDSVNGTPRTGIETRPFNYSVNRIIKY